jgi:hypothetical protein
VARRKGGDWFVVEIRADAMTQLVLAVSLDFLVPGVYCIRLYRDGTEGKEIEVEELAVRTTEGLRIAMAAECSFAVRFSKGTAGRNLSGVRKREE